MLKIISLFFTWLAMAEASVIIGVGGFDVEKVDQRYCFKDANESCEKVNITEVLQKDAGNIKGLTIWITKDWEEEWYPKETVQKEIIDKGYIPLFIFYWFADDVSVQYIQENKDAYFKALRVFSAYIQKLDGLKLVVLNPEYNMNGVEKWEGMNDIFLKSYEILRRDKQVLVGPCVGDFGDYNYTNEIQEWSLSEPSIYKAAKHADFIAFQEMRALTKNTKTDILNTPKRAFNFSKYLYRRYKKPTLLAYLAISTYGTGGEEIQADVYKEFVNIIPQMRDEAKLIYFGIFHYFDYPGHEGYFKDAEEHFGVVQKDGTKKPSFKYFKYLK